jgi:hypothetical protein
MTRQMDMFGGPEPDEQERRREGLRRGVQAAKRAAEHADEVRANWQTDAYLSLIAFLSKSNWDKIAPFQTTDVRRFAESERGLEAPPDSRAWGNVIMRAARARLIEKAGYAPCNDPKQHGCPTTVWKVRCDPPA